MRNLMKHMRVLLIWMHMPIMEVNRMKITAMISIAFLSVIASLTTGPQGVHAAGSDVGPAAAVQQSPASFPVIVVFREDAPLEGF